MRRMYSVVAALGGLSMTMGGTTALAAACGGLYLPACPVVIAPPPPPVMIECTHYITEGCQTPVVVKPSKPNRIDPMVVTSSQPMDHLRRFTFSGSPHVNIMRVYGKNEVAGLEDAPSEFTSGCSPESTQYCRSSQTAMDIVVEGPSFVARGQSAQAQAPYIAPPAPAAATQSQTPRVYGSMVQSAPATAPVVTQPAMTQPQYQKMQAAPSRGNWARVSGPTMIGNMPATSVVCRQPNAPIPPMTPVVSLPPLCTGPTVTQQYYGTGPGWTGGPVARRYGSYY